MAATLPKNFKLGGLEGVDVAGPLQPPISAGAGSPRLGQRRYSHDTLESGRAADLTLPMLTALGKDSFLSLTKFLLHVLHNIIANPHKKAYRKMKTASRTVMAALQKPATIDLLKVLNMRKEDEYYIMDDDPVDVAKLEEIMNAIIATRKRLNVLEAWEVFPTDIVRNDLLGAGTFGEVYSGTFQGRDVALKTLQTNASDEAVNDFTAEADIMKNLRHNNVLSLIGVVMSKHPRYIITELMKHNFIDVLRNVEFTVGEKLGMAMQVVAGLEYLHHQNVLHCDLAARNVLVSFEGQLKISDFGLARHANTPACDISQRVFPVAIRWSAPEVLPNRRLTKATDIWSFGVLFFEIMTSGLVPYMNMTNADVQSKVPKGYRLPCPADCPEPFHDVMMQCWDINSEERPEAKDIVKMLLGIKIDLANKERASRRAEQASAEEEEVCEARAAPLSPNVREMRSRLRSVSPSAKLRGFFRRGAGNVSPLVGRARKEGETLGPFSYFVQHMGGEPPSPERSPERQDSALSVASQSSEGAAGQQPAKEKRLSGAWNGESSTDSTAPVWFHGRTTSKRVQEKTEPLLRKPGDFVVHESAVPGDYILSVMSADVPLHIDITRKANGTLQTRRGSYVFDNIEQVIDHHLSTGSPVKVAGKDVKLKRGIPRSEDDTISEHSHDEARLSIANPDWRRASSAEAPRTAFICYQPETEGDLARSIYDALQSTSQAGSRFTCFLDQYDLAGGGGHEGDSWHEGTKTALEHCKVFVALISERALKMVATMPSWDTALAQYEMALKLRDEGKLEIVPIFVGQSLFLEHPEKKGKFFKVYEDFDGFSLDQFPSQHSDSEPEQTIRRTMERLFALRPTGIFYNPEADNIATTAEEVFERFSKRFPEEAASMRKAYRTSIVSVLGDESAPQYERSRHRSVVGGWRPRYMSKKSKEQAK